MQLPAMLVRTNAADSTRWTQAGTAGDGPAAEAAARAHLDSVIEELRRRSDEPASA